MMSIIGMVLQTIFLVVSLVLGTSLAVTGSGFWYYSSYPLGVLALIPLIITLVLFILFILRRKIKYFNLIFWVLGMINLLVYLFTGFRS